MVKSGETLGETCIDFDFLLDTVSAAHDYSSYLGLLKRDRNMVLAGLPDPIPLSAGPLIMQRRHLSGSLIGGIRETQEMLDFCAEHGVVSNVEVISIQQVNEAYERVIKSDVRYRFVIDLASLQVAVTGQDTQGHPLRVPKVGHPQLLRLRRQAPMTRPSPFKREDSRRMGRSGSAPHPHPAPCRGGGDQKKGAKVMTLAPFTCCRFNSACASTPLNEKSDP